MKQFDRDRESGSLQFSSSGDVTQAINPWAWMLRSMAQIGLVNISVGRTPNPNLSSKF
jgi:hypothetical protein